MAGLLARSQRVVAQAQSLLFKVTSAADRAKTAKSEGAASTADLLSSNLGGDRAECSRNVRTANAISKTLSEAAMAKGLITIAQAEVIVRTLAGLPSSVTQLQKLGCEEALIEASQKLTLKDLRRRADRISDIFAADKETADKAEQKTLADREREARGKTQFRMIDQKDGTYKGGFTIPEMHADILKTMLDAIAAPRRDSMRQDQLDAFSALRIQEGTWTRRQGLAFSELLEHFPTDHLPAGSTTLTANFDFERLQAGIGAATLSTGTRISIDAVRRMACEAKVIPMVFNGQSLPLDMGRGKRLFTRHQRIAIANRDGGCTFPGCDRPPNWCEIHHANRPWAAGGQTDLRDGVLICNFHHHLIHDDGWAIRFAADGHPEYIPPKSADFRQRPRRNQRWRAESPVLRS